MPEATNPIIEMRTTLSSETDTITPQDNGEIPASPETPVESVPEPSAPDDNNTGDDPSSAPDDGNGTPEPLNNAFANVDFEAFKNRRDGVEAPAKPIEPAKPKPTVPAKDFTGIDEADQQYFQRMSNDAFAKQKEIYIENRKLKEQLAAKPAAAPVSSVPHPEAYKLDPEYVTATKQLTIAESVENHLAAQLEAIAQGEKWFDLEVDDKGQIFVSQTAKEPSEKARVYLNKILTQTQTEAVKIQGKVSDMAQNYAKNYQQDVAVIQSAEEKYFPGYDDPKHPTRATQDAFINQILPPSQRNNPLAKTLAKTVANNSIFRAEAEKWKKQYEELEKKFKALTPGARGQQPTARNITPGTTKTNGRPTPTYEDFLARRAGI